MKKYAIAALAALMAVSATACSGNKGSSEYADTSAESDSVSQTDSAYNAEAAVTGDSSSSNEYSDSESGADLQAVYDKIIEAQDNTNDIIMFQETTNDTLDSFYKGLTELDLKQILFYMPPVPGNACEILLVEAADSENADKAKEIMKARVKAASEDTGYPEVAEVWQTHAMVQRSGNLLCMIALPMDCTVPDDVFAL